jgi:hypothetical protein
VPVSCRILPLYAGGALPLPAPVSAADYLGCTFTRRAADYRALTLAPVSGQGVGSGPPISCGPVSVFGSVADSGPRLLPAAVSR